MKCLETRTRADGLKRRRYARQGLPNLTTLEVPLTVLKAIGMEKIEAALETHRRGDRARAAAAATRAAVLARQGVKATAVAHELGITEARVRQIRSSAP
jgi:hypothetical protein